MTLPSPAPTIRPARPGDVPAVVAMVHELADYERAPEQCHLTEEQLTAALFAPAPALYGHVAVDSADQPIGFALWFLNFSTWEGVHGIYLEDLYVRPAPGVPAPDGCCSPPWPRSASSAATGGSSGG